MMKDGKELSTVTGSLSKDGKVQTLNETAPDAGTYVYEKQP
jgi:hypothetical protein